jgi:NADPH:quinone reductase-like Zn-dependent oxidoreductase
VGGSSFSQARRCLARGGRYLVTVGGPKLYLLDAWGRLFGGRRLVYGMSVEKRQALVVVSNLVARRALRPVIDRRYPLEDIVEAHRYVETRRKRGNVVIDVGAC